MKIDTIGKLIAVLTLQKQNLTTYQAQVGATLADITEVTNELNNLMAMVTLTEQADGYKRTIFGIKQAMYNGDPALALAALVGTTIGKSNSYTVFGQKKSIAGSTAFLLTSYVIIILVQLLIPETFSGVGALRLTMTPFVIMLVENLGVFGTDNILIPLAVAALLA